MGGCVRGDCGKFIFGFASNISSCSIITAELQVISMGLPEVVIKDLANIAIESGSLAAINLVHFGCSSQHPLFHLTSSIESLLLQVTGYRITHVHMETKQVADNFAKFGLSLSLCNVY